MWCSFQVSPRTEKPSSRQQMLYSVKVRSQKKMQDSTQCLASLAKEKRWAQSRVYKMTGFRLRKMPTTARPLRQPQVLVCLVFEEVKTPPICAHNTKCCCPSICNNREARSTGHWLHGQTEMNNEVSLLKQKKMYRFGELTARLHNTQTQGDNFCCQ